MDFHSDTRPLTGSRETRSASAKKTLALLVVSWYNISGDLGLETVPYTSFSEVMQMASLGNFLVTTDIRGSVGGTVYTKSRSTHVLRARVKPRNPRSTRQSAARANMAEASRQAQAFSPTEVLAWKAYADSLTLHNKVSGTAYKPSWIQAYNTLAIPFLGMNPGDTPPTTPPTDPFTGDTITVTAAGASGKITFTGSAASTSGIQVALLVQKLPSPNREPNPKGYVLNKWGVFPGTPFHLDTTTLEPGVYAIGYKWGNEVTGQETLPVFLANVTVS